MQIPVARQLNRRNFVVTSRALRRFRAIPFFGTLLGIVRDKDIIKGDDDVDFYVEGIYHKQVIEQMVQAGFSVSIETAWFLQFSRKIGVIDTYVDIYLYENDEDQTFIVDKWNFFARHNEKKFHLYIDKSIIFPLKKKKVFGASIFMPSKPEKCCKYLYGKNWRKPASKFQGQYKIVIVDNSPFFATEKDQAYKLLSQHDSYDIENRSLKSEIVSLTQIASDIRLEKNELASQTELLRQQNGAISAERDSLQTILNSEKERLNSELLSLRTAMDEMAARSEILGLEKNAIAADLDALQASFASEKEKLLCELQELKNTNGELVARVEVLDRENNLSISEGNPPAVNT